jgi:hypothetical protein
MVSSSTIMGPTPQHSVSTYTYTHTYMRVPISFADPFPGILALKLQNHQGCLLKMQMPGMGLWGSPRCYLLLNLLVVQQLPEAGEGLLCRDSLDPNTDLRPPVASLPPQLPLHWLLGKPTENHKMVYCPSFLVSSVYKIMLILSYTWEN